MNMSTVSRVTREVNPSEATVISLWDAFQSLAEERGVELSRAEMTAFFNAGGFSTSRQSHESLPVLENFKDRYQEIQKLKQQLEEKERIIEQLRQENKRS
jgi:6-phosphofructokinase